MDLQKKWCLHFPEVPIHTNDIAMLSILALNISAFDFMDKALLNSKAQSDPNIKKVGDFYITLSSIDMISRKKDKNQQRTSEENASHISWI